MLFPCFLAIVLNFIFDVSAYVPITIGQENVIPPNEIGATPVWQTFPPTPSSHPGYEVTNVGNTTIQASIYWKDSWPLQTDDVFCEPHLNCSSNSSVNVWYELADPVRVEPSESAVIKPSTGATFYFTRLVIVSNQSENSSDLETIVNVKYENVRADLSQVSEVENLKNVFKMGCSKLPPAIASSGMDALIELFWPENKTSVWDEVLDQVRNLIDQETYDTINSLLTGRLMGFKRKLEQLSRAMKEGQSDVRFRFMNLAQDFIGLEEEAIIRGHNYSEKLNQDLLPVYSNIILMKSAVYTLAMKCHERMNLTQSDLINLRRDFTDMIRSPTDGANYHISQIFRNQSADTDAPYTKEMYMRNKIKEHGYIPIWNNMLDQPGQKLIVDEMFYSDYDGVYYGDESVLPPSNGDPLSSAGLIAGKYNEIQKLIIYQSHIACTDNCCADAIVGLQLTLKNGDTFKYGKITHAYRVIELNGTYRIREMVIQDYANRVSNLYLSLFELDKNEWKQSAEDYRFGCPYNNTAEKYSFAKENFYIASIYAIFDDSPRRVPAAYPFFVMGVSFLPLQSHLDNTVDENNWKEWKC